MRGFYALLSILALTGCGRTTNIPAVSDFELERYMGTWYEAARLPHRFEEGLSSVSATYSLNNDGTVKVVNRGYDAGKEKWDEIEGTARLKGDEGKGWLKVSFFKPFWASYKVVHIDTDYSRAVVAGPTYDYLWILVRDAATPKNGWIDLAGKAATLGFDTNKLIEVSQTRNLQ